MELIALISLIICIVLIISEYLWLYALARKQENYNDKRKKDVARIANQIEAILTASTEGGRMAEVEQLKKFINGYRDRLDDLTEIAFQILQNEGTTEDEQKTIIQLLNRVAPHEFYRSLVRSGDAYDKAAACQKVAMFFKDEDIPEIRKHLSSKNKELVYNAAMTLSRLGDEDGLSQFIISCGSNFEYSHRLIKEFLENYSGDLERLCERVFEKCDDYIRSAVIKGITQYRLEAFARVYQDSARSNQQDLAAASILALGTLAEPEYEHLILTAANHANWVIRSAAVKALAFYPTQEALDILFKAAQDPEWWVRYNAAVSLVKVDKDMIVIEKILKGYDKYASDAMKYVLYRETAA